MTDRERVAQAIYHGVITDDRRRFRAIPSWAATSDAVREEYLRLADLAIDAMHPPRPMTGFLATLTQEQRDKILGKPITPEGGNLTFDPERGIT